MWKFPTRNLDKLGTGVVISVRAVTRIEVAALVGRAQENGR